MRRAAGAGHGAAVVHLTVLHAAVDGGSLPPHSSNRSAVLSWLTCVSGGSRTGALKNPFLSLLLHTATVVLHPLLLLLLVLVRR